MEWRSRTRRACRLPGGRPSLRAFLRREHGGALIEVMMGALIVALAATAVFKGVDGASAVSGGSKSRALAAAVAQDDQERLRSLAPQSLVDLNQNNTVARSGVNYKVNSTTRWVADRDAVPDCESTTSRAGYIRITSTVTWPDMRGSRPVVAVSLVAPPNGTVTTNRGAAGIRILNGREPAQGVAGVNVTINGAGLSKQTDANGCAFFDDVPQGTYSYTATKAGFIDPDGNTQINRPLSINGGQTKIDTAYLDQAQTVNFAIRTRSYSGADQPMPAAWTGRLNLTSAKLTATYGLRTQNVSGSSAQMTGVFPTQYGTFIGNCAENNPAEYGATTDSSFTMTPTFTNPETVYLPPIKVLVRFNGQPMPTAKIKIVQKKKSGSSCTPPTYPTTLTTNTQGTLVNLPNQPLSIPNSAPLHGTNAFPYGRYAVCAWATVENFTGHMTFGNTSTTNETPGDKLHISPNGTDVIFDANGSNHSNGPCP